MGYTSATIIAQNARVARSWRSRFQESEALKLQSVPPYVATRYTQVFEGEGD
jgi:hypothetical protein